MVVKKSVFKFLCLTLAVGMALTSCKKDDDGDKPDNTPEADTTQHNNTPEEVVVEDKGVSLHSSELYEYMKTQTDELQTYDVKIVDATPNFDEIVKALCENNKIHVSLDFGQCTGMKEFPDGAFTHRYSTDLMNLVSVTIPNSVTKIGASAFSKCVGLTSIAIPDGVTEIGARAFWKCTCLMTVKLPASLKTIGKEAFYNCITLSEINLPDNVADIEENAFSAIVARLEQTCIACEVFPLAWFFYTTVTANALNPPTISRVGCFAVYPDHLVQFQTAIFNAFRADLVNACHLQIALVVLE